MDQDKPFSKTHWKEHYRMVDEKFLERHFEMKWREYREKELAESYLQGFSDAQILIYLQSLKDKFGC